MATEARKNSKQSAREAAQAAKAASEAQQKKRDRTITMIGIAVVVVIVGAIVAIVLVANKSANSVALPNTVTSPTYGFPVGSAPSTTPTVQLFEDFQCPICAQFERGGNVAALEASALAGNMQLSLHPMIFIDQNQNNDSSIRATNAWGCAINAGVGVRYHSTVFRNQPKVEGTGYTQAQLIQFGVDSGIKGAALTTFTKCVNSTTYQPWANKSEDYASSKGVNGTPTILVNGKPFDLTPYAPTFSQPAKLVAAILAAGKK